MSFVSYAQNFEDVMLWRALKHVENGFYIDIGAQDPIVDSVSMAFYEHGWRGVHVEPTQQYSRKLRNARPDETVLQVAIGNAADSLTFFEFENTGLSTADVRIAQTHIDSGFAHIQTVVPVISLDGLFEQIGNREIHWLKLDVEGLEKSVLESWVVAESRPWILVVESTKPLTQEQTHGEWEELLFRKQYRFVYFDGLNRFYVSSVHSELASAFLTPPNIFDGFVLSGQASQPYYLLVENKAQQAENKAQQAENKAQQAENKAQQAENKAQKAETAARYWQIQADEWHELILALHASTSWRITKPLRAVKRLLAGDFVTFSGSTAAVKLKVRETFRPVVSAGIAYVFKRPVLRKILSSCLKCFPKVHQRLLSVGVNSGAIKSGAAYIGKTPSVRVSNSRRSALPADVHLMTPRARQIYNALEASLKNKNKREGA